MTWLAPWAFVGLLAVAAPLLVHWLARHQATRLKFPTIQFLVRSSPLSVKRYRLRDLPLLAVRMAIVVAAVAALAQPVWVRPGAPAARPARAVVVDTSASLGRALPDGRAGIDVARETAAAVLAGAGEPAPAGAPSVTVPTERLSEGVAQAAAWLAAQAAPRELVVVSDFQVGALVEADLDGVPADAGVRLVPIAVSGPVPAVPAPARGRLRVLVGREDEARAAAAESAARSVVEKTSGVFLQEKDTRRLFEVVVLFQSAPGQADLRAGAQPIDTPELFGWVADISAELSRAELGPEKTSGVFFAKKTPDVFSDTGLAIFTDADPGSVQAAALMAAVLRAAGPAALTPAEREPDTLALGTLQAWQRPVSPASSAGRSTDRFDGRWLWALTLALFGVEAWMRRRPAATTRSEAAHADAA